MARRLTTLTHGVRRSDGGGPLARVTREPAFGSVSRVGWSGLPFEDGDDLLEPRWGRDFDDLSNEWRRLFAEVMGTFLLVLAAAGGQAVSAYSRGAVSGGACASAPGLMAIAVTTAHVTIGVCPGLA